MSNPFLQVAVEAAREAGAILLAEYARPVKISYKGEVDLVTEADRRSEDAVVAKLRTHFPKHIVVAEEGTGHEYLRNSELRTQNSEPGNKNQQEPEITGRDLGQVAKDQHRGRRGAQRSAEGKEAARARYRWYVDPLDGTTNFAHGYPCFAVSIALTEAAQDGANTEELLAGVVYNPMNDEMFTAARGEGAYLNGRRIGVSKVERLATSLLGTGFPSHKRTQNPNIHYYWEFTLASHGVRRDGSAALDLCMVACGRFDGFWEFGLKPWDTAAGVLIVREAGGIVSDLEGRPYALGGASILASNGLVHEEMRAVAAEVGKESKK
ncbi:MAG: inositol monophosphatase family protein [Candidatus Acidiferrales bacterium]